MFNTTSQLNKHKMKIKTKNQKSLSYIVHI